MRYFLLKNFHFKNSLQCPYYMLLTLKPLCLMVFFNYFLQRFDHMNVEFVDHKSYLSLGICYVCSTLIILTGHPNIRNFFLTCTSIV